MVKKYEIPSFLFSMMPNSNSRRDSSKLTSFYLRHFFSYGIVEWNKSSSFIHNSGVRKVFNNRISFHKVNSFYEIRNPLEQIYSTKY